MFDTPQRNHPTYVLERLGSSLLLIILLLGNLLTAGTQNIADLLSLSYWQMLLRQVLTGNFSVLLSAAGIVLVLLFVLAFSILRWSRTFFHIEGEMLYTQRRTIFKKESKLPVTSITTVNVEQNVFEKLVGTAKVKIDINSAVTANKTDFIFILKKETALQLKNELIRLRDAEQKQTEETAKELLASFTITDALKHKLLSIPFVEILTAGVVFVPMFVGESAIAMQDALKVLAVSAVMYMISLLWGTLNLADFRLETDNRHIYISHGMLRSQNYAFEKERVKAVFLKQSLLARLFGLCSVELAVVGLGNEKNESPRLCLLVPKERAEQLIAQLLPAYTSQLQPTTSSRLALIPAFLLSVLCAAITSISVFFMPYNGLVLTVAVLLIGIAAGVLSQKTRTLCMEENLFCCSSGIFNKKTGRFLYRDLQEARLHTNALMQKGNVGRIGFSILSAKNVQMQKTGWFKTEIYDELCQKILK